jgi:hypothetical protein
MYCTSAWGQYRQEGGNIISCITINNKIVNMNCKNNIMLDACTCLVGNWNTPRDAKARTPSGAFSWSNISSKGHLIVEFTDLKLLYTPHYCDIT